MASLRSENVTAWTREQIEAWVNLEDARAQEFLRRRARVSPHTVEDWATAYRIARRHMVRLAPECLDYQELRDRLWEAAGRPMTNFAPTPEDTIASVEDAFAALWARSLSDAEGGGPA